MKAIQELAQLLTVVQQYAVRHEEQEENNPAHKQALQALYDFADSHNGLALLRSLQTLSDELPCYRRNTFVKKIGNYAPFQKEMTHYKPNLVRYEDYDDGQFSYKLDVSFEPDGTASVIFWIPVDHGGAVQEAMTEKLQKTGLLDKIDKHGGHRGIKDFLFGEEYSTMEQIDQATLTFVQSLLSRLKTLEHKP